MRITSSKDLTQIKVKYNQKINQTSSPQWQSANSMDPAQGSPAVSLSNQGKNELFLCSSIMPTTLTYLLQPSPWPSAIRPALELQTGLVKHAARLTQLQGQQHVHLSERVGTRACARVHPGGEWNGPARAFCESVRNDRPQSHEQLWHKLSQTAVLSFQDEERMWPNQEKRLTMYFYNNFKNSCHLLYLYLRQYYRQLRVYAASKTSFKTSIQNWLFQIFKILVSIFYLKNQVVPPLYTDFYPFHTQILNYVRENIHKGINIVAN